MTGFSFSTSTAGLDWVSNHDNTRWFLVIRLSIESVGELNTLLDVTNRTAVTFGQPPLYSQKRLSDQTDEIYSTKKIKIKPESTSFVSDKHSSTSFLSGQDYSSSHFHISIGWALNRPKIKQQNNQTDEELLHLGDKISISVASVKAKIGNNISTIPLATDRAMSNGIMGQ